MSLPQSALQKHECFVIAGSVVPEQIVNMKEKVITSITVCLVFIVLVVTGWQFSEWTQYNKLLSHKGAQPFKSFQIGVKEQQFIDEFEKSWKIVAQIGPDKELEGYCKELGFEGNVSSLSRIFTIRLPEYSLIDFNRNRFAEEVAGVRWMMAIRPPEMVFIEPEIYHREGFIYVRLGVKLIQVYEDKEDGIHGIMYANMGIAEQNAAEQPATRLQSKSK